MIFPTAEKKIALFIRHAERFNITRMSQAMDPLITEKGRNDAFLLGKSLTRFCPLTLHFSPVQRCRQTAEAIHDGIIAESGSSRVHDFILDLGGPYLRGDWQIVADLVDKIGQSEFISRWFNNEYPSNMIDPLEKAAHTQLAILADQLENSATSTINVTHDWNVMILREYFLNLKHSEIGEPGFLDGLVAYNEEDSIVLSSMNKSVSIKNDAIAPARNR